MVKKYYECDELRYMVTGIHRLTRYQLGISEFSRYMLGCLPLNNLDDGACELDSHRRKTGEKEYSSEWRFHYDLKKHCLLSEKYVEGRPFYRKWSVQQHGWEDIGHDVEKLDVETFYCKIWKVTRPTGKGLKVGLCDSSAGNYVDIMCWMADEKWRPFVRSLYLSMRTRGGKLIFRDDGLQLAFNEMKAKGLWHMRDEIEPSILNELQARGMW